MHVELRIAREDQNPLGDSRTGMQAIDLSGQLFEAVVGGERGSRFGGHGWGNRAWIEWIRIPLRIERLCALVPHFNSPGRMTLRPELMLENCGKTGLRRIDEV